MTSHIVVNAIDIKNTKESFAALSSSSASSAASANRYVKNRRAKRVNVISLSDEESDDETAIYAKSLPTSCMSSPLIVTSHSSSQTQLNLEDGHTYGTDICADLILKPVGEQHSNTLLLRDASVNEEDNSDSDKLSNNEPQVSEDLAIADDTNSQQVKDSTGDDVSALNAKFEHLKSEYHEKFAKFVAENETLIIENNVLKLQLKKYIAAVQLLKYGDKKNIESLMGSNDKMIINTEDSVTQTYISCNEVNEYEKKLAQVAEMHGEVVEFNDHLHHIIQQKDSLINRLKQELIALRGPLPDCNQTADTISIADTDIETASIQSSINHPLIHIWIPTAFLAGNQRNKSHHVYQIYIRIKDEEWNVYRRYSQFYSLHKQLRKTYPLLNSFNFPPKKTIGNKDSKVVQERRKKLEHYLRNAINVIQSQTSEIRNKEHLISVLPFLSEPTLQNDGRSRSDTHLNALPTASVPHYIGL